MTERRLTATVDGGCIWCLEADYGRLRWVERLNSGYAGGTVEQSTCQDVCSGSTGHAEEAQIVYDPALLAYDELLEVLWRIHDPTTCNRQGADKGSQYRSVIFYHDEAQRVTAERSRDAAADTEEWADPIVTEIAAIGDFYPAEPYRQDYYRFNSLQPYSQIVIVPKLCKLHHKFQPYLREEARHGE